jgi:hypothetical protein
VAIKTVRDVPSPPTAKRDRPQIAARSDTARTGPLPPRTSNAGAGDVERSVPAAIGGDGAISI